MSFFLFCYLFIGDVLREQKSIDYSSFVYKDAPYGIKASFDSSVMIVSLRGEALASGSGNLLSYKGELYVVTASHVVEGNLLLMAIEKDGTKIPLKIVFQDKDMDMAFLKLLGDPKSTKAAPIRFAKDNLIGKPVYHCGHPAYLSFNISEGIITSIVGNSFIISSFSLPGSSGSIVFDEDGRIVGVVSSIMTYGDGEIKELVGEVVRVFPIEKKYLDDKL